MNLNQSNGPIVKTIKIITPIYNQASVLITKPYMQ